MLKVQITHKVYNYLIYYYSNFFFFSKNPNSNQKPKENFSDLVFLDD